MPQIYFRPPLRYVTAEVFSDIRIRVEISVNFIYFRLNCYM